MPNEQDSAPIAEAIKKANESGYAFFCIPGHKAGLGARWSPEEQVGTHTMKMDLLEQGGFDDRQSTGGFKEKAQELAAKAFRGDKAIFSTTGSTLSAHVCMLSIAGPGDEVLIARNAHLSTVMALLLSGVEPVFVRPQFDPEFEIAHGITPEDADKAFAEHPSAKGLLITSPSYYGIACDVKGLADVAHKHGKPLIVDEAWGAEFPFSPELPPSAMECGADVSFSSLHKASTGLAQSSIINVKGSLVDSKRIEFFMELLRSTSESGLILASLDESRRHMAVRGEEDLGHAIRLSDMAREQIGKIDGLKVMSCDVLDRPGACGMDRSKILIDLRALGRSGFFAYDWLRSHRKVCLEVAEPHHILAIVTLADTEQTVSQLIVGLKDFARLEEPRDPPNVPRLTELMPELQIQPRHAFFAETEMVDLEQATGRVSAEPVCPYPPGIPMLVPGESFTEPIVRYLKEGMRHKMFVSAVTDESLKQVRVVA